MNEKYEQLWSTASAALTATVADLTARFGGGVPFFNALDARLQDPLYFNALVSKAFVEYPDLNRFVVSGWFGRAFAPWLTNSQWGLLVPPALVVPGGLRHRELEPFLVSLGWQLSDEIAQAFRYPPKYVLLDDSCYKFRTFNKIKQRIDEAGARLIGHVVLYDGSRDAQAIPSFYRWHPAAGYES